jgi:cobyrinic acid a,c-diamide synthase
MAGGSLSPNRCPALLIGACASGQGKTTVTAALARFQRGQGRRVRVFKTGPDFLDPMILERAAGGEAEPLDLWMVGPELCAAKLYAAAGQADLILIEGAMGLFDGEPSAADLAERFGIPVVPVIDARGMGQTFGALAQGLARYRPGLGIAGLVANRVASDRHAEMVRAGIPAGVPFLGCIRCLTDAALPSRHLGLVQAEEVADLDRRLDAAAALLAPTDLAAPPAVVDFHPPPPRPAPPALLEGRRIAVARDTAFAFVYPDNLRLLAAMGAELVPFSPLHDGEVVADAIYLPGGYPELHLNELGANRSMLASLRAHVAAGRPIYAECGGMLYLLERLVDKTGHGADLLGLLPGEARMQPRLAGLGMQALDLPGGRLRGHSFHHSTMRTPMPPSAHGRRQVDDRPGEPFYRHGPVRASYLHLYFPSAPRAAASLFSP